MDERTFDAIAKHLAARPARRRVLKGLVGGLTASLALVLRRHPAAAAPCAAGTHRCKGGTCQQCCRTRHCPKGQTCHKKRCRPRGGRCVPIPGLGGGGCLDNAQCCSLTCQDAVCCNGLTRFCLTNEDCCSGHCDNQTCLSATCIPSGEACFRAAECCTDPFCSGGFCASCLAFGDNCQANPTACCAGICTGICICVAETGVCTKDDDCCSGACSGGHCVSGAA